MLRRILLVLGLAVLLGLWAPAALAADMPTTTSPSQMSDYALYGVLLGFFGTYVAAFINRVHWKNYWRFGTFFVWSMLASAGDAYFARELDWGNWIRALLIVVVAGVGFYNLNKGAIVDFEANVGLK